MTQCLAEANMHTRTSISGTGLSLWSAGNISQMLGMSVVGLRMTLVHIH